MVVKLVASLSKAGIDIVLILSKAGFDNRLFCILGCGSYTCITFKNSYSCPCMIRSPFPLDIQAERFIEMCQSSTYRNLILQLFAPN